MRRSHRLGAGFPPAAMILLLLWAVAPAAASAQSPRTDGWAAVPLLGFGVLHDNGWGSAGMEAGLELEYAAGGWRGNAHGSLRGLGMGCSEACYDGGPALAAGAARAVGRIWIGGGAGLMKHFSEWRVQPFGRLSTDVGALRLDLRLEFPAEQGLDVYVPLLVGIPLRP